VENKIHPIVLERQMDTIELNTSLYYTSWDLKAAFDSPSKNLLRLSWTRLGIPDDIVNWLVEIDIGGKSYIKSPLAVHNTYSSPAYLVTAIDTEYFTGECRVRQGDDQGPLCFLALYNILLTMLHKSETAKFSLEMTTGIYLYNKP
jgi:hypothetical protein